MKIYFVRHGRTEWNAAKRLQGQHGDSPLLPESYAAIARVRRYLSGTDFVKVFSSPQRRAMTTAQGLCDAPITPDGRLAEWDFGELEGTEIGEAIARFPQEMHDSRFQLADFDGRAFGGEAVNHVLSRFDSLARESLALTETGNVLWVGHGASGTAGIRHLAGYPLTELRAAGGVENNTVNILESTADGDFRLIEWNKRID